jgi:hypothetical protein
MPAREQVQAQGARREDIRRYLTDEQRSDCAAQPQA